MEDLYAIKNKNDKFIGVDKASGGYPYEAYGFRSIEIWPSLESAASYVRVCKHEAERDKWYIVKIVIDEQLMATPLLEYTTIVAITHYADSEEESGNKLSPLLSKLVQDGSINRYRFVENNEEWK